MLGLQPMQELLEMEPTTTDMSPPTLGFEAGLDALLLSSGYYHTCALLSDDSISCWGSNEFGQIGNGEIDGNLGVSTPYSILNSVQAVMHH